MGDWSPILDTTPESMLYACFVPDEKWGYPAPGPRRSPVMRSTARPWFKVNSWRSTVGEFHDEWKGVTSDTRSEGVSPDTLLPIDTRNAPEGVTRDVRSEGTDGAGTLGGVREAVRPRASTLDRKITFQTVTRGG